MLTKKIDDSVKLPVYGYILGVELEDGVDPNAIMRLVGETLNGHKGVGTIDIELLGEIEIVNDEEAVDMGKLEGIKES